MGLTVFNLAGIREALFRQLDWAPSTSKEAKARVNEFIQRAYLRLSQDAPYLFFEDEIRWGVLPDTTPSGPTDLLKMTADSWVLETELLASDANSTNWDTSWAWQARVLLVRAQGDTTFRQMRIRDVWLDSATNTYKISLETPWRNTTDTGLDWRVVMDEFVFPDNMIELRNASVLEDTTAYPYPIQFVSQQTAEALLFPNTSGLVPSGIPRYIYRREHQQMSPPRTKPAVAATTSGATWVGPDAGGTFEYIVTYARGVQGEDTVFHSPPTSTATNVGGGIKAPYWESAPSPISSPISVVSGAAAIKVTLPDIDRMLGFDGAGTERSGHSGVRKLVYRRRVSSDDPTVEPSGEFYYWKTLLGGAVSTEDTGSHVADTSRPFRAVHGYQTFRLHPKPSKEVTVILRAVVRPQPLADDQDVPRIHEDGIDCLIERAAAYLYEAQGNAGMADRSLRLYETALLQLNKRYGTLAPSSKPRARTLAKPRQRVRYRYPRTAKGKA